MIPQAEVDAQREIDLERYKDILPTQDEYDQRLFFLRGIVNLTYQLGLQKEFDINFEQLIEPFESEQIEKLCCVSRKDIYKPKYRQQIIVGLKYGTSNI